MQKTKLKLLLFNIMIDLKIRIKKNDIIKKAKILKISDSMMHLTLKCL